MDEYQFTERRACRLVGISRSSLTYQARPDRHARLRERLITLKYQTPEEFAAARPFDKTQWAPTLELLDGSAPSPIAHAAE